MVYTPHSLTWHTDEESRTKEGWEEGHVSSAVISNSVNALSNRNSAQEEKNLNENQDYYQHTVCEELKGAQIKEYKYKNEENVKKKKSHARIQRRE